MLLLGLLVVVVGMVTTILVHLLPFFFRTLIAIWRLKKVPLPTLKGNFLTGHAIHITNWFRDPPNMHIGQHFLKMLEAMCYLHRERGIVRLDMGMLAPIVLIFKASFVEDLLKQPREVNKSEEYFFLKPYFGDGILTSTQQKWKKQSHLLRPTVSPRALASFQNAISQKSKRLVENLAPHVDQEMNTMHEHVENFAIDGTCSGLLGFDIHDHSVKPHPISECVDKITGTFSHRLLRPWWWSHFLFQNFSEKGRRAHRHMQELDHLVLKILANGASKNTENKEKWRRSFVDHMLHHNANCQPSERIEDAEIKDNIRTTILTGSHSLGLTMLWTIYLLGRYPETQERAWQEVDDIFNGDKDRPITEEDLKRMFYIEAALKESSRVVPISPIYGRYLEEDLVIGGEVLPKNTNIIVMVRPLQQNPDIFPDPEVFDPTRFLNVKIPPYTYVPFSEGPRKCIGFTFAMQEMKTALSDLLRHYRWTSLDPFDKVSPSFTHLLLHPGNPIRLRLEIREGEN